MGIRKCAVKGCLSTSARVEDTGVTFHSIPLKSDLRQKWVSACKIEADEQSFKKLNVCSRHFRQNDFHLKGHKYLLIRGATPTIFPWGINKTETASVDDSGATVKVEPGEEKAEVPESSKPAGKWLKSKKKALAVKRSASMGNDQKKPQKKVFRKSSDSAIIKKEEQPVKKFDPVPGTEIEARDFNNVWHKAKVVEVDSDDKEVLIHFEGVTNEKSLIDEWIPKDSIRLRPLAVTPQVTGGPIFRIMERCFARWSDSRKFKATVQKILPNNYYEVLFDDGYVKVVPARHITRMGQKSKKQQRHQPAVIESTGEEWFCHWVDDCPMGVETQLDGADAKKRVIIVEDHRLPEGFVKYFLERPNVSSKWDVVIRHPSGKRFRSRQEVRSFMEENGEPFNLADYDFAIHKKKAKEMGVYTYTDDYRKYMKSLYPSLTEIDTIPKAAIQPLVPLYPAGDVVEQNWLMVDGFKVQIIDNLLRCPKEGCLKNFRKENLLKIHIKHYHEDIASKITAPPTMTDLAYQRTKSQIIEDVPGRSPEPVKKSQEKVNKVVEVKPKLEIKVEKPSILEEVLTKTEPVESPSVPLAENYYTPLPEVIKKAKPKSKYKYPKSLKRKMTKKYLKRTLTKRMSFKEVDFINEPPQPPLKKIKLENEVGDDTIVFTEKVQPQQYINEHGEVIKIVRMKQEEIINCLCGLSEEDGLMIQCELCLCWQHGYCNNILKESEVPEKYICYICRYPDRGRTSMKYVHDQDWLFEGKLPTGNYHYSDKSSLQKRFDVLKKTHTLTGNLLELKRFMHSLKTKLKIADNKDHPKLYLWSKRWDPPILPESEENKMDVSRLSSPQKAFNPEPNVPQPEAAIDSRECQRRLLEHIKDMQSLAMNRLDSIEQQIEVIESFDPTTKLDPEDNCHHLKGALRMMIQDMGAVQTMALTDNSTA